MSYILDALRKSERDRQIAMRQGASLLYAVPEERRRVSPGPVVRAGVAVVAVVAVAGLWWRLQMPAVELSLPARKADGMPPAARGLPAARTPAALAMPNRPSASPSVPVPKASASTVSVPPGSAGARASAGPVQDAARAETDVPFMNIAGYIGDEHGLMAMINDKLVREGDEIEPGLRLEKILDNGSVFSYKGRRFRR